MRARTVLSRGEFQQDLETGDGKGEPATERARGNTPDEPGSDLAEGPLRGVGQVASILLYLVAAVILVLLLIWIVLSLREWRHPAGRVRATIPKQAGKDRAFLWREELKDARASAEELLVSADRLAHDGRADEAVHLLLLSTIEHLSRQSGGVQRPSSTSRELLEQLPLGPPERRAFRDLVLVVEASLFGGRAVSQKTYSGCRQRVDLILGRSGS